MALMLPLSPTFRENASFRLIMHSDERPHHDTKQFFSAETQCLFRAKKTATNKPNAFAL